MIRTNILRRIGAVSSQPGRGEEKRDEYLKVNIFFSDYLISRIFPLKI